MRCFKIQEDGSYFVTIKNPLWFWLAIDHTSFGRSFHQIATATVTTQQRHAGLSDHMVGQFVRVIVVVALEMIANVIDDPSVWAFALAADAPTYFGVPMLDQHARMCFKGIWSIFIWSHSFFWTPHNSQLCQTNVSNPRCNAFIVVRQTHFIKLWWTKYND